ncbi:MAG: hypothetical protein MJ096_00100 [Clostridia bacterium]|nr:hypothetical protein [Clostridia bacterium]
MGRFRDKLLSVFRGCCGIDSFGKFTLVVYVIIILVNLFFGNPYVYIAAYAVLAYTLFRFFSKNTVKRSAENRKYLKIKKNIGIELKLFFDRFRYIKTARFRKCSHCRAIVKLPNVGGKHTVKCPKCGEKFDVNILL